MKKFITFVPYLLREFSQGRCKGMDRIERQLRIGNMPLNAFDGEFAAHRATASVFDHVASPFNGSRFTHNAPVELFTTGF